MAMAAPRLYVSQCPGVIESFYTINLISGGPLLPPRPLARASALSTRASRLLPAYVS